MTRGQAVTRGFKAHMFHRKARKHCSKCGKSTEKAEREMCKRCGSTAFVDAHTKQACGFPTDQPPPPPAGSAPFRRPQRRLLGRSGAASSTASTLSIGSWEFRDEDALHEEEGIGTWAPVVRSWSFHTEDDCSPSIASTALPSPRTPSIASTALPSPRSGSGSEKHASSASPGIGSWAFGDGPRLGQNGQHSPLKSREKENQMRAIPYNDVHDIDALSLSPRGELSGLVTT